MAEIEIFLPDGSARSLPEGATARDLAASISRRLEKDAVAALVDGQEVDLGRDLPAGAKVAVITADHDSTVDVYERSGGTTTLISG